MFEALAGHQAHQNRDRLALAGSKPPHPPRPSIYSDAAASIGDEGLAPHVVVFNPSRLSRGLGILWPNVPPCELKDLKAYELMRGAAKPPQLSLTGHLIGHDYFRMTQVIGARKCSRT